MSAGTSGPAARRAATGPLRLGVVADDMTGAADVAEQVWRAGATAAVVIGVPEQDWADPGTDCVVVALKNRSTPPAVAAAEAFAAARALHTHGFGLLYQKYCSTFDSTPRGNIGPIGDAIAEVHGGAVRSIGTPATPSVGRTVRDGRLFVHGLPLDETPMARHPITPMTDSRPAVLLRPQTARPVTLIGRGGPNSADPADAVAASPRDGYLLADAVDEHDLDRLAGVILAEVESGLPLVAHGGAGLAAAVIRTGRPGGGSRAPEPVPPTGRRLVLSGSLSDATRRQNAAFGGARVSLDATRPVDDEIARVVEELRGCYAGEDGPVLVTSLSVVSEPALVPRASAEWVEAVLAGVARRAVDDLGVARLLVAGGETSGAVVHALGIHTLRLARSVSPGVAWSLAERRGAPLAVLLKSGNFGRHELFNDAWDVTA